MKGVVPEFSMWVSKSVGQSSARSLLRQVSQNLPGRGVRGDLGLVV